MSKYIDQTELLAYQSAERAEEERFASRFGLRSAIMADTERLPWLTPKLKDHLASVEGRDTRIPAIKKGSISTTTVMSYDLPLNLPETDYSTLTLNTLMVSFGIYPEDYENQHVSKEQIMMNRYKECDEALALDFEALIYSHLNDNKTAVWGGDEASEGFVFDEDSDTLQVSLAASKDDTLYSNLRTMADYNNWNGDDAYMVDNPLAGVMYNKIRQYGAGNDKNLMAQELPVRYTSRRVTNTSGMRWSGFFVERGSIGVVPNFTLPFRIAKSVQGGKFDISDRPLPMLGANVGLYAEEGAKASSVNSNMSWVDKYAFIYSFFLLKNYNSDTTSQVGNILKIDAKKS